MWHVAYQFTQAKGPRISGEKSSYYPMTWEIGPKLPEHIWQTYLKLQKNLMRPLSRTTQTQMTWTTHLTQTWRTQGLKAQNLMRLTSQMMLLYSHLQMCSSSLKKQGLRQSRKHKSPKSVRDITKGTPNRVFAGFMPIEGQLKLWESKASSAHG